MAANSFFSLFLVFSSLVYVAFSEGPDLGSIVNGATAQAGGISLSGAIPCMQKLIACKPYLNASSSPPPPTCCDPLKEMIASDTSCLCSLFTDPELLKPLNVSQTEILKLPDGCGATIDVTACKKATTSPESSGYSETYESALNDLTSPESSKACAIFGGFGLVVSSLALFMAVA